MLGDIMAMTSDPFMAFSNMPTVTLTSNAPSISNFQVSYYLNYATFSGQVTDESAPGLTVQLGGLSSLMGESTTVGSNGWFYLTVQLQPNEQGTATADVLDWWMQSATQATVYVQN